MEYEIHIQFTIKFMLLLNISRCEPKQLARCEWNVWENVHAMGMHFCGSENQRQTKEEPRRKYHSNWKLIKKLFATKILLSNIYTHIRIAAAFPQPTVGSYDHSHFIHVPCRPATSSARWCATESASEATNLLTCLRHEVQNELFLDAKYCSMDGIQISIEANRQFKWRHSDFLFKRRCWLLFDHIEWCRWPAFDAHMDNCYTLHVHISVRFRIETVIHIFIEFYTVVETILLCPFDVFLSM